MRCRRVGIREILVKYCDRCCMLMTCLQLIVKKPRIVQSHQLVKVHCCNDGSRWRDTNSTRHDNLEIFCIYYLVSKNVYAHWGRIPSFELLFMCDLTSFFFQEKKPLKNNSWNHAWIIFFFFQINSWPM